MLNATKTKNALIALTLMVCVIAPVDAAIDFRAKVDPLVEPLIDNESVVGMVVGIYKDGETQVIGYGEVVQYEGQTPDGDTIYEIGSISKTFTGTLLADLIERDRVKLDDLMYKYLPRSVQAHFKEPPPITLEQLVTHTSGLPRIPSNLLPRDVLDPYADYTRGRMYDFLKTYEFGQVPRDYDYSNYGMGLLGELLARREGTSYEKLLIERIVKPAGMVDTCIKLKGKQRQRLAKPYNAALVEVKSWDMSALSAAGGIRSTANDMLKFVAANLADDDQPLSQACRLAHEKRCEIPSGAIGLAWHINQDGDTYWHNGMTGGYASWVSLVPDQKLGIVVLANTATDQITNLGLKLQPVLLQGKEGAEAPAKSTPAKTERVSREVLKSYEGVYAITPQFEMTVTLDGGRLSVQATGQGKIQLRPVSETKFSCRGVDAQITFVSGQNGKAEMLILHQNGVDQVARRRD